MMCGSRRNIALASDSHLVRPAFDGLQQTLVRLKPRDRMRMRTMLERDLQRLRSELSDAREDDIAGLVNGGTHSQAEVGRWAGVSRSRVAKILRAREMRVREYGSI